MDELYRDTQNKGPIRAVYPDDFIVGITRCQANWNKIRMDLVCSLLMGTYSQLDLWMLAHANWN